MDDSTLLSIKEFSNFANIKQSTLRYYDEIGLLPAVSRGENNYRYYLPYQTITLNFINVLIDLGFPLSVIKDLNETRTPENLLKLLKQQETLLDSKLHDLQTAYSIIHTYRNNIQTGLLANENELCVHELAEIHYILGPANDFTHAKTFYKPFMDFCNLANRYRINLRFPIGGVHDNMDTFINAPGQPNRFFSMDPRGNRKIKTGNYLTGYIRGYYGQLGDLPERMASYAKEHNLIFKGPVYVVYLLDEISIRDKEQYLSQVVVAVAKKKLN
ncbi:MAG: MerR family DNA-binding transcriptional regulator [Oscillospiraceae bacterium]|nr:MerR family DNA-binding transcriptional regulator [Oscillospiraceae bacterium]